MLLKWYYSEIFLFSCVFMGLVIKLFFIWRKNLASTAPTITNFFSPLRKKCMRATIISSSHKKWNVWLQWIFQWEKKNRTICCGQHTNLLVCARWICLNVFWVPYAAWKLNWLPNIKYVIGFYQTQSVNECIFCNQPTHTSLLLLAFVCALCRSNNW